MTQASDPVVIAAFARTPMGSFQGALSPLKATELGAAAVRAAVARAGGTAAWLAACTGGAAAGWPRASIGSAGKVSSVASQRMGRKQRWSSVGMTMERVDAPP